MNEARYFLPHLLALSTSSPFWQGRDTGLKSYRTTVFRRFPRTRHPRSVRLVERVRGLPRTRSSSCTASTTARKCGGTCGRTRLFGTLEFRICDVPTSPRVTIALAALAQAIVVKLYRLRQQNLGFRIYSRALVEENKWRAARYGLDGTADRLRQAQGSADARARRSNCSSSSTTWWTSSAAGRRSTTCTPSCRRHQRRSAARRSTGDGDLRAVVALARGRDPSRGQQEGGRREGWTALRPGVFVPAGVHRSGQHARAATTASPRSS